MPDGALLLEDALVLEEALVVELLLLLLPLLLLPFALERRTKSEVAHKWARWLHNPSGLGVPLRFRAGGRMRSGPLVGKVAT